VKSWLGAAPARVDDELRTARLAITRVLRRPLAEVNPVDLAEVGRNAELLGAAIDKANQHRAGGR
jgi:hypothetical protein